MTKTSQNSRLKKLAAATCCASLLNITWAVPAQADILTDLQHQFSSFISGFLRVNNPNLGKHGAWRGNFAAPAAGYGDTNAIRDRIVRETNEQRRLAGLGPLQIDAGMDDAAQMFAEHVLHYNVTRYFPKGQTQLWHDTPHNREWFYGENAFLLPFQSNAPERAVPGWMNSPGHRANILDRQYERIGVGVAYDPYSQSYVFIQKFSASLSQPAPQQVTVSPVGTGTLLTYGAGNVEFLDLPLDHYWW